MAARKLKPIEERDEYAALVFDAWYRIFPEDFQEDVKKFEKLRLIKRNKVIEQLDAGANRIVGHDSAKLEKDKP